MNIRKNALKREGQNIVMNEIAEKPEKHYKHSRKNV
jgi:hypothetical protein